MKRARVSSSSSHQWADLPQELLTSIVESFNNHRLSLLRFRAVCRSWRAVCPLPSSASSMFPLSLDGSFYKKCSVTVSTVYLIEPLHSEMIEKPNRWLVMLDELNPGKFCIRYPLSKIRVSHQSDEFPKELNLLDFRVTEIAHSYNLSEVIHLNGNFNQLKLKYHYWNMDIGKVLLVPPIGNNFDKNCLRFVVLDYLGSLMVFSIRNGRWDYTYIRSFYRYDDIVHFKGSMYAVNRRGMVFSIDYNSFKITKISSGLGGGNGTRKRLVLSSDENDLYLLIQSSEHDGFCYFSQYILNEGKGKWVEVSSLNDQVFFVGADCSFSFPAQAYPSLRVQENCIFASRHGFGASQGRRSFDWLDYINRDKTKNMTGMFKVRGGGHYGDVESCDMFWPHLSWVASSTCVSKTSMVDEETKINNTCEGEGELHGEPEASGDEDDVRNIGINKKAKTSIDDSTQSSSVSSCAKITERETLPLEMVESRNQDRAIQETEDCEVVDQKGAEDGALEEKSKSSPLQLLMQPHSCLGERTPSPSHDNKRSLCMEDFKVPDSELHLLQAVLECHPEAFARLKTEDAWMRGWAAMPALRAFRLLREGHDGGLSEVELREVGSLVNAADREGVEVSWLRRSLLLAWEYHNCGTSRISTTA